MFTPKKIIILLFLLFFTIRFFIPLTAQAQAEESKNEISIQIPIPGMTKPCDPKGNYPGQHCVKDIAEYINAFYKYFAGVAGILAATMIVFAGFRWITAGGNATRIEGAKSTLNGAFIGLVLTLTAYVLLNTINPELVTLRFPPLMGVKKVTLATHYCKDLIDFNTLISSGGITDGNKAITSKNQLVCAREYSIPPASAEKAGYTQNYCCGHICPQGDSRVLLLCGNVKGEKLSGDCPQDCYDAKRICEEMDENKCGVVDQMIIEQDKEVSEKTTCRKQDKIKEGDNCVITPIYNQCKPNEKRVSCTFFGEAGDVDTPCWAVNRPKSIDEAGHRKKCTNDARAGAYTDSICCAKIAKSEIDCRDTCQDSGRKNSEVEVSCDEYNLKFFIKIKYQSGGEGDDKDQCPPPKKCCLQLELRSQATPPDIPWYGVK